MSGWRCAGLTFRYPESAHPAVLDLSLEVPSGATTAVLGPNGSGKSTLLRLLLGTLAPSAGTVEFGGTPVARWGREALARTVGVVPQGEESVFPVSVRELVGMGRYPHLGAWRREGDADRRAVEEAMRRCGVWDLAARPVPTLSGGERQRARVARALAQEAPTLALDEPTAALGVQETAQVENIIRQLKSRGIPLVLISHNLRQVFDLADRIVADVARDGVPFTMAWQMRVDPQNVEMKRLVQSGTMGRVYMVRRRHGLSTHTWPGFEDTWHVKPELNRGMWADDAAHAIDGDDGSRRDHEALELHHRGVRRRQPPHLVRLRREVRFAHRHEARLVQRLREDESIDGAMTLEHAEHVGAGMVPVAHDAVAVDAGHGRGRRPPADARRG